MAKFEIPDPDSIVVPPPEEIFAPQISDAVGFFHHTIDEVTATGSHMGERLTVISEDDEDPLYFIARFSLRHVLREHGVEDEYLDRSSSFDGEHQQVIHLNSNLITKGLFDVVYLPLDKGREDVQRFKFKIAS